MGVKDLRKAAFAVGFGFTMGKFMAACVSSVLEGSVQGVIKSLAKKKRNRSRTGYLRENRS